MLFNCFILYEVLKLTRNVIYQSKENLTVHHMQKELGPEIALPLNYNEKSRGLSCPETHCIDANNAVS